MTIGILVLSLVLSLIVLLPLGIKWELDKRVILPAALIIGVLSGLSVAVLKQFWQLDFFKIIVFQLFVIISVSTSLLVWRFFRDPEREPPDDKNVILSPADGRIIYVKKIEDGGIPYSEKNGAKFFLTDFVQSNLLAPRGTLIGIAMNFLDVHVNRSPIDGRISLLKHIKGLYISLKRKEAVVQNERVLTVIDNDLFKVGIVQIASRLVRKIVPYIKESNRVRKGQRIGMIRFGSQVDIYLPEYPTFKIKVSPDEKVKAGVSVIATYKNPPPRYA